MELKFSKEINNICKLNFSNELFKQPKPLFYTKNIPQKPINFRKKCQKKSLKCSNPDRILNLKKNPEKQPQISKKESLRLENNCLSTNNHRSNQKPNKRDEYKVLNYIHLIKPVPEIKEKFHKSLEHEPMRKQQPKRNLIEQLKNYQFANKKIIKKHQFSQIPQIMKNVSMRSYVNLPNTAQFVQPKVYFENQKRIPINSFVGKQKNYTPENKFTSFPLITSQIALVTPLKANVESKEFIDPYTSSLRVSKVPLKQMTQQICLSQPQLIKQFKPKVSKVQFGNQSVSTPYSQSFKRLYGEIELEDEIKQDLMASVEVPATKYHFEHKYSAPDQFMKPPQSQKSTVLPSQSKLRKIQSDGDYFDALNISKKSYPNVQNPQIRTQPHIFLHNEFNHQIDEFQFQSQNQIRQFDQNDESIQIRDEQQYYPSEQYDGSYQRHQNFRSIISVHSECGRSSQSQDSIIINNHPQQSISSKPIRTLF